MANIDEFHKKVELSLGAIVWWTTLLITITFSASTIYWNFNAMQTESDILSERSDKRHTRLTDKDEYLERRITELEKQATKIKVLEQEVKDLYIIIERMGTKDVQP